MLTPIVFQAVPYRVAAMMRIGVAAIAKAKPTPWLRLFAISSPTVGLCSRLLGDSGIFGALYLIARKAAEVFFVNSEFPAVKRPTHPFGSFPIGLLQMLFHCEQWRAEQIPWTLVDASKPKT